MLCLKRQIIVIYEIKMPDGTFKGRIDVEIEYNPGKVKCDEKPPGEKVWP